MVDAHRRKVFEARGLREIRFANAQVFKNIDSVVEIIKSLLSDRCEEVRDESEVI
jgi:very-short-patch-repair endonuclease